MEIVGVTCLGGLWALQWTYTGLRGLLALEWGWPYYRETCAAYTATESKSEIPILYLWYFPRYPESNLKSQFSIFDSFPRSQRSSGQTDGQTDMARSTRLVILIKEIYTLWGRKRFLLPVTYFPTNLVYTFCLLHTFWRI